jgi:hypothetical protein
VGYQQSSGPLNFGKCSGYKTGLVGPLLPSLAAAQIMLLSMRSPRVPLTWVQESPINTPKKSTLGFAFN